MFFTLDSVRRLGTIPEMAEPNYRRYDFLDRQAKRVREAALLAERRKQEALAAADEQETLRQQNLVANATAGDQSAQAEIARKRDTMKLVHDRFRASRR